MRGIDHVGIRYRDLPRAVAWFRDVLGLHIEHEARTMLRDLEDVGISLKEITDELQHDGVEAFSKSFDIITETTAAKAAKIREKAGAR